MIREQDGRLYVSGPVTLENAMRLLEAGGRYLGRSKTVIDFRADQGWLSGGHREVLAASWWRLQVVSSVRGMLAGYLL